MQDFFWSIAESDPLIQTVSLLREQMGVVLLCPTRRRGWFCCARLTGGDGFAVPDSRVTFLFKATVIISTVRTPCLLTIFGLKF